MPFRAQIGSTPYDSRAGQMFRKFRLDFRAASGMVFLIMADQKQRLESPGGGRKFNVVGVDTRDAEEPVVAANRTGYWLRITGIALVVVLLAALLFYLNDQNLGKTNVQPTRGGHAVSLDTDKPATDPNLK